MCIRAAQTIADFAYKRGINEDYIIPTMEEWEVYPKIASEVGMEAIKEGIAEKKNLTKKQLYKIAKKIITEARKKIELMS
jgi:malate dehydrogenase (oxaloacetate-decarboxylating)